MQYRMWVAGLALMLAAGTAYAVDQTDKDAMHAAMAAKRAEIFAQADTDGDGALTPGEFATFRQLMQTERQNRFFAKADANGDGKVTLDELANARAQFRHGRGGGCGK